MYLSSICLFSQLASYFIQELPLLKAFKSYLMEYNSHGSLKMFLPTVMSSSFLNVEKVLKISWAVVWRGNAFYVLVQLLQHFLTNVPILLFSILFAQFSLQIPYYFSKDPQKWIWLLLNSPENVSIPCKSLDGI